MSVSPRFRAAIVLPVVLAFGGCGVEIRQASGPVQHLKKTVELDKKSEMARIRLKMGAGELKMEGGSPNLLDADFTYNIADWKPEVRYDSASFRTQVDIEQPGGAKSIRGDIRYEWNIRLNDDKPMSVDLEFGAGKANLDLGSVTLRNLDVNMGVGELDLDLRGKPKNDYQVRIHGGVGQATVNLPKDVAIVAEAHGGIGSIDVKGLHKRGGRYVNDAYEANAKTTIRLDIQGGIGQIVLNAI